MKYRVRYFKKDELNCEDHPPLYDDVVEVSDYREAFEFVEDEDENKHVISVQKYVVPS